MHFVGRAAILAGALLSATVSESGPTRVPEPVRIQMRSQSPSGPVVLDASVEELFQRPRQLTYDQDNPAAHGGAWSRQRAGCAHGLNLPSLRKAVVGLFRRARLDINETLSDHQLIIVSQPRFRGSTATFYSYVARFSECVRLCRITVAANRVSAPIDRGVIRLSRRQLADDSLTGSLVDAAEPLFDSCYKR